MQKAQTLPALVLIKWHDITSSHTGWFNLDDMAGLEPAICYTPGWILKEDDENYYVASSLAQHKDAQSFSFDTVLPKGIVVSITTLRKRLS